MANEALQNMSMMMGMMGQVDRADYMEKHGKVYDMQAQKMADEKAATDAAPALFRQMQENPQFMDSYRPQTATELAAFANARKQYLETQEGQIKSFQNLTSRAQQNYQAFAAPAREALSAFDKGDTTRAMDLMQTASNFFPDPMRVTGYDQATGEAIISRPNPKTGGYDEVGRKSPEELMQMTKTMLAGGRVRSDGVEINPEFAKAYGLTAFAASEENHKLAQDFADGKVKTLLQGPDGKVIHAAPQYDFESHDYNYFVPGKGALSKQQLAQAGFGFTTEQSVQQAETGRHNRVAEGLAAEGHAIQREGQAIQRENADLNRKLREDANADKQVGMLDKAGDDLLREEDAIYKRYSQVPTDPNNLAASLMAQKQDGLQNLQKAAQAGDEQAKVDLARSKQLRARSERIGDVRMKELDKRFPEIGMGVGTPASPTRSAPSQSERGLGYGQRVDGSDKGAGYFGELARPDGGVSTEISVGVNIGGKETEIPLLVPTLDKKEIDHLLSGGQPTDGIMKKAVDHAQLRIRGGKSPFAQSGEQARLATGAGQEYTAPTPPVQGARRAKDGNWYVKKDGQWNRVEQ